MDDTETLFNKMLSLFPKLKTDIAQQKANNLLYIQNQKKYMEIWRKNNKDKIKIYAKKQSLKPEVREKQLERSREHYKRIKENPEKYKQHLIYMREVNRKCYHKDIKLSRNKHNKRKKDERRSTTS